MKKPMLLFACLAVGFARVASAGDLIAYWNFDTVGAGRAIDVQAGNAGLLLNGAQFTNLGTGHTGGATDRGLLFGNDRHRMHVVDGSFLNAAGAANAISISFWQTLTLIGEQTNFWANSTSTERAFSAHAPWSDSTIYWDTGGGAVDGVNRISINPGAQWLSKWEHVVLVKNGDTKRIYVNGVEATNGTNTAPLPTDFTELFIGNNGNTFIDAVEGTMDDIAIFKRELTPGEVMSIFNGANPASLDPPNDTDGDTLPDAWELRFAANLTVLAPGGDADSDGILDQNELAKGTNPNNNDTDGDGALDGTETETGIWVSLSDRGTSPFRPDTDSDGILDGAETNTGMFVDAMNTGTNPHLADSDGDGAPDGFEVAQNTDPTDPADLPLLWIVRNARSGGTLNSIASVRNLFGPNGSITAQTTTVETVINFRDNANGPFQPQAAFPVIGAQDVDANSFAIKATGSIAITTAGVYTFGFNSDDGGGIYIDGQPVIVADIDRGSTTSLGAVNLGVGPHRVEFLYWENGGGAQCQVFAANSIGDFTGAGSDDATILANYHLLETSVFNASDSDGDGIPDAYEESFFPGDLTKLGLGDFDGDTVNDPDEFANGTDPTVKDTDMDGLTDGEEIAAGTNPLNPDTDGDGLLDGVEDNTGIYVDAGHTGTNPNKADTDGDKWTDGQEVGWPSDPNLITSFPSILPNRVNLLAYWNFDDATTPTSSLDCVHGFAANFFGTTVYSGDAGGVTGAAGDRALNLGTAGGSNGAHVRDAKWFGLGIPPDKVITNLGSLGSDADMNLGAGVAGAAGALVGSADTAVTNTAPNNSTRVPYTAALNPPGTWSSEVWFKPAATMTPGQLTCAISNGDFASPRKGWLVYQSDTGWNLRTYYNDGLSTAVNITGNNGAPPVAGTWTHLAMTWDGTVARLYVDGVLRITSDPRSYVPGIAGGFNVGSRADGAFQWSGDMDEVAFYGTVLSDADVAARFANARNPTPAQPYDSLILASNPLGYWRMTDSNPGPLGPDQASVSFWQKLDSFSDSSAFWATAPASNNAERGFQAHSPWGDQNVYFDTSGCCDPPQRITGPSGAVLGQWEHFVYQKIGDHKEVWRNGVMILSGDGAARLPNEFTRLTIGAQPSGDGGINATRGLIDDFAVFGNFLSPDEIGRLYSGESPKSVGGPPTPLVFTKIEVDSPATTVTLTWHPGLENFTSWSRVSIWRIRIGSNSMTASLPAARRRRPSTTRS